MVRGIEDTLSPAGYTALLTNTDGDVDRAKTAFETTVQRGMESRNVTGMPVPPSFPRPHPASDARLG